MIKRLRIKFVIVIMTIVAIMLGVIFGVVYFSTLNKLEYDSMQNLERIAMNPIHVFESEPNAIENTGGQVDRDNIGNEMPIAPVYEMEFDEERDNMHLPYITIIVNDDNEIVANLGGGMDIAEKEFLVSVIQEARAENKVSGTVREYNLRYASSVTPIGQCYVFVDITNERAMLKNLVIVSIVVAAIAFLIFLGISILFSHWAVKPVEEAWKQQKQFVADASHELKTPLTVIMTDAELLDAPNCSDSDRRKLSDSILSMSGQMRGLVESMLELARLDSQNVQKKRENVNMSELVDKEVMIFEPTFFEKDMILTYEVEPGITVVGDGSKLKHIVGIFLDNAIKYASEGGETKLKLEKISHGHCRLSVANQGEPISSEDLANLFKRFYRADKARKMDHSYGLGLSIAKSIVDVHNGKIWAESKNGYNTFYVELQMKA